MSETLEDNEFLCPTTKGACLSSQVASCLISICVTFFFAELDCFFMALFSSLLLEIISVPSPR